MVLRRAVLLVEDLAVLAQVGQLVVLVVPRRAVLLLEASWWSSSCWRGFGG